MCKQPSKLIVCAAPTRERSSTQDSNDPIIDYNLDLAAALLHHLAILALIESATCPDLGLSNDAGAEMVSHGIGLAGCVHVAGCCAYSMPTWLRVQCPLIVPINHRRVEIELERIQFYHLHSLLDLSCSSQP